MVNGVIICAETDGFYLHFQNAFHIMPKIQVSPDTNALEVYC